MILTEKTNRPYSDVVRDLVRLLIKHPDKLEISESFAGTIARTNQTVVCVNVSTHPEDRPQVIGRSGMRVNSIHHILQLIGDKRNERVNLTVANRVTEPRINELLPSQSSWHHDDDVRGILERLLEDLTDTPWFVEIVPSNDRTNIFIRIASRAVISEDLLKMLQQFVKGYGLIRGWRVYLTLQFLDEGQ